MSTETGLPASTQRAYTLRLAPATPGDPSWRDRLWRTHAAVNRGAAAFGDWLLTLRGGLSHELAELPAQTEKELRAESETLKKEAKKAGTLEPDETAARQSLALNRAERLAERRVLLALSWLTVEVGYTGPDRFNVGRDKAKVVEAFSEILRKRGLSDGVADWRRDCEDSLKADIKEGATWVNRCEMFDDALATLGSTMNREEIWDLLLPFFGSRESYLEPLTLDEDDGGGAEEKAKDLVQKAGQWLSSRFGTGDGVDFELLAGVYDTMKTWASAAKGPLSSATFAQGLFAALASFQPASPTTDGLLDLISGPGYKSATRNLLKTFAAQLEITSEDLAKFAQVTGEDAAASRQKTGGKGHREWSNRLLASVESQVDFTYLGALKTNSGEPPADAEALHESARHREFAVLLDHAARRVSLAHTWAKRAEAERRRFTRDAAKLDELRQRHPTAVDWLDRFCAARTGATFAEDAYRIRPRAVEGWKELVAKWRQPACQTEDHRIQAARELQGSDEIEKFGDIQLFEAVAAEEARGVWESGPEVLRAYAVATDAQHKKSRFKVPAYCHPDPLVHPVFCDFGNSRWEVDFAFHRRRDGLDDAESTVIRRKEAVAKSETQLSKAKNDDARRDKRAALDDARRKLAEAEAKLAWLKSPRGLSLGLLDGPAPVPTPLRWQSKRLAADLALGTEMTPDAAVKVTRANRQGLAAGNAPANASVAILGLFEQEHWNCRLQAPRDQLDRLADYLAKGKLPPGDESRWDEPARCLRDHLEWLVTFSAKLQPQGPWVDYIRRSPDQTPFQRTIQTGEKKGTKVLSLEGWPHGDLNDGREGRARLLLCRLPGLRLLSADLGHRFGAACAVWVTLSREQLAALCQQAGAKPPGPEALHFHLPENANGKKRTAIFRRIGPDTLPDGTPHPAPWARLERQFLIKLQGEEADARMASPVESQLVEELEADCGIAPEFRLEQRRLRAKEGKERRPSRDVDEVMAHAVDTLRLALKRHAVRARLARDLNTLRPPGNGGRPRATDLQDDALREHLTGLFLAWFGLASSRKAPDAEARRLWDQHIAPRLEAALQTGPEERESAQARKQRQSANEKLLAPAVNHWTQRDRIVLAAACHQAWANADASFQPWLARVRDWLRPGAGNMATREQRLALRRTGGLSLSRLTTLRGFWNLQKAFAGRERWDDQSKQWGHPPPGEHFGQRALDAIERLREQRVKQLASRIAAAALGLAPASPTPAERDATGSKSIRLSRERLAKLQQRFAPCHAVVIESLSNYRPDQLQTRRENRQLMQWSSSKVKKFLAEACQLGGLHLREVPPAYTSRQDSRTGAPGLRCRDVLVADLLREGGFWQAEAKRLATRRDKGEALKPREQLILDSMNHWQKAAAAWSEDQKRRHSVRFIQEGAELFVSADATSPTARGLQADLNAAANIGLKALLDPDWEGSWWMVPCVRATHAPKEDAIKGCPLFKDVKQLAPVPLDDQPKAAAHGKKQPREIVNLWRSVSAAPLTSSDWKETTGYWEDVKRRVAAVLRQHNGLE